MVSDILEIKNHLKSKEVSRVYENGDGETTTIENFYGDGMVVNNITFNTYTNDQTIDDNITAIMKTLEEDSNVGPLSIISDIGGSIEKKTYIPKELNKKTDVSKLNHRSKEETSTQTIVVSKVDFLGNSKWTAHLNGNKINVEMKDNQFKKNIGDYNFTLGTKMNVEMKFKYDVDKNGIPIKGSKTEYTVLKVNRVVNDEVEQTTLFNEQDL